MFQTLTFDEYVILELKEQDNNNTDEVYDDYSYGDEVEYTTDN